MSSIGHNSGETTSIGGIASESLKQGIDRWERLEAEVKDLRADQKDVLAGLKSHGFDLRIVRKVLALRKMDAEERREQEELLDLYLAALGEGR